MPFQPLKLLLYLTAAALEVLLLHLGVTLLALAFQRTPSLSWPILFLACLIAAWTMLRFETAQDEPGGWVSRPTLVVCALTMAYAVKVQAGGGWSLLGGWGRLWPFGAGSPDTLSLFGLLMVSLWSWWRGMGLVDYDHARVLAVLQRGVLVLVLLTILVTPLSAVNLGAPPWGPRLAVEALIVVGLGLFGLSLARIVDEQEAGQVGGGWYWLRSSLLASVGVLLLGTLLLTLVSSTATEALRTVVAVIVGVFALVMAPLVWLIAQVWLWLKAQLQRSMAESGPSPSPSPSADLLPQTPSDLQIQIVQALQVALSLLLYLLPLVVLILLIMTMRRQRHSRRTADGVLHESLWSWQRLGADLLDLLQGLRLPPRTHGLRDALARLRPDDPAERIRRRYVELLLMGERAERSRQPQQTPLEYSPVLAPLVPSAADELQHLTDVYDRARYAPDTITAADVAAADAAWAAIQAQSPKENP
ncbi:MAG TPA: DUF4129 domain-containing protein [Herpetosiphonaceae bacterium]